MIMKNIAQNLQGVSVREQAKKREIESAEVRRVKDSLAPAVERVKVAIEGLDALQDEHGEAIAELSAVDWVAVGRVYQPSADPSSKSPACARIVESLKRIQGWFNLVGEWQRAVQAIDGLTENSVKQGAHLPLRASIDWQTTRQVELCKEEIEGLYSTVQGVHDAIGPDALPEIPVREMRFIRPRQAPETVKVV